MTMKFLIFAANLTLLLSFPESEGELQDKNFVIGFKNLDYLRSKLPKDNWYLRRSVDIMNSNCRYILKAIWIFSENYSDTSNKPPFGMIHRKYEAFSIGTLILYYDNNPVIIPAFCCQHDDNMAIYISYNTNTKKDVAFRKTSTLIHDTTMTPGQSYMHDIYPYERTMKLISKSFYKGFKSDGIKKAIKPIYYCLSLFWRLSRYQIQSYEAHTIISNVSGNTLHCESFLFAEVYQHGYFLSYDIEFYVDEATKKYQLILKGNDRLHLVALGYLKS